MTLAAPEDRLLDLLAMWDEARQNGRNLSVNELCPDDPEMQKLLSHRIEKYLNFAGMIGAMSSDSALSMGHPRQVDWPHGSPADLPSRIDRYRVDRVLGQGGFGIVYLAIDEDLNRWVAIKVPHGGIFPVTDKRDAYLAEARAVATLDHPHIVAVYDVGSTVDFPCYVVTRYVEGRDLASVMRDGPITIEDAVRYTIVIAESLHHAHLHGIVHRDIKPQNIIISKKGEPSIVDFGSALRDHSIDPENRFAGTPAYMSPEQARGESHRVDGRSDLYSLGTILYEMLSRRRPFQSNSQFELLRQIVSADPKPLRQIDDRIPVELERICLKGIAKRAGDRYLTGTDLADELRRFMISKAPRAIDAVTLVSLKSDSRIIVPKGLRSFDEHDADFFIELLPGPKDREGIPDCLRFWLRRVDPTSKTTFAVGLLYGPSGSGKSSLFRAGLIPRMSPDVATIYLDATQDGTEVRLLRELKCICPSIQSSASLKQAMATIRSGSNTQRKSRVLIVFDQFEQWLHAHSGQTDLELVNALRECDGINLQCVVVVRDDFWLSVSRLFEELEIRLEQGKNVALVDQFDVEHSKKVLRAFGKAFGKIGDSDSENEVRATADFIDRAVAALSVNGRIISVHLALFAEMMKWKPWVVASLDRKGVADEIGIEFLEESFVSPVANPAHRAHELAVRKVLAELLPKETQGIHRRAVSRAELIRVSGYANRPERFEDLLQILDHALRLVSPIAHSEVSENSARCYQLTHDFMIPALRVWLFRKQKETRRGRAELLLSERSDDWNTRPKNQLLPTLTEFIAISVFARSKWSVTQHRMMMSATKYYGFCGVVAAIAIVSVGVMLRSIQSTELQNRVRLALNTVRTCRSELVAASLTKLSSLPSESVQREIDLQLATASPEQALRLAYCNRFVSKSGAAALGMYVANAPLEEQGNLIRAMSRNGIQSRRELHDLAEQFDAKKDWLAKARIATIAMHLGDPTIALDMSQIANRPDPLQRTIYIESLASWHGDLSDLAQQSRGIDDACLRSALCMGMTCIPIERVSEDNKNAWQPIFYDWFLTAREGVTHSAAGLPIIYWGLGIPTLSQTRSPILNREWFMNALQMTMIRVPTAAENNPSLASYMVCDREVSVAQYVLFLSDPTVPASNKPNFPPPFDAPTAFQPANQLTWADAILFCNWLSGRENLDPCYVRRDEALGNDSANWVRNEDASGYRLPTVKQWEHSARAGTTTSLPFAPIHLAARYANIAAKTSCPIGVHLPNGYGLMDMMGNVGEWCDGDGHNSPVIMGGSFHSPESMLDVGIKWMQLADTRTDWSGFRVVLPNRQLD